MIGLVGWSRIVPPNAKTGQDQPTTKKPRPVVAGIAPAAPHVIPAQVGI